MWRLASHGRTSGSAGRANIPSKTQPPNMRLWATELVELPFYYYASLRVESVFDTGSRMSRAFPESPVRRPSIPFEVQWANVKPALGIASPFNDECLGVVLSCLIFRMELFEISFHSSEHVHDDDRSVALQRLADAIYT
jgi:hypothetical protein